MSITCPRCFSINKNDPKNPYGVTIVGDHYFCENPECGIMDEDGHIIKRTQFKLVEDEKIKFPYNEIFIGRRKDEFYRKPYIET